MQEVEYVHEDELALDASAEEEDMEDLEGSEGTSDSEDELEEGSPEAAAMPSLSRRALPTKRKAGMPKKLQRGSLSSVRETSLPSGRVAACHWLVSRHALPPECFATSSNSCLLQGTARARGSVRVI